MRKASAMRCQLLLSALISILLLSLGALVEGQENKPEDITIAYSNPGISTLPVNIAQERIFRRRKTKRQSGANADLRRRASGHRRKRRLQQSGGEYDYVGCGRCAG